MGNNRTQPLEERLYTAAERGDELVNLDIQIVGTGAKQAPKMQCVR